MSADDQRAADDGWTPIPETAACPAECEDCQVTVDRLRAELAETRAAGDALAFAVAPIERMGRGAPGSRLEVLITRAEEWRSVRGDAPAPAEPPAAEQCVREGLTPDIDGGTDTLIVDCSVHGEIGRISAPRDRLRDGEHADAEALFAEHVRAVRGGPPAVELPVTLSSVDDVAAVCLAHGLTVRSSGPGWTQWRDPDTKAVVHCEAWQSGVERVTVAGRDRADIYRPVARGTLVAAIEAAWGGSR